MGKNTSEMTYEAYKADFLSELSRQVDENREKIIVVGDGTPHEEVAIEIVNPSLCSQAFSLWYLYEDQNGDKLPDQVRSLRSFCFLPLDYEKIMVLPKADIKLQDIQELMKEKIKRDKEQGQDRLYQTKYISSTPWI
nr:hypothetical protein [uncultured Blautia sp.]